VEAVKLAEGEASKIVAQAGQERRQLIEEGRGAIMTKVWSSKSFTDGELKTKHIDEAIE
jgi:hypothetical protein